MDEPKKEMRPAPEPEEPAGPDEPILDLDDEDVLELTEDMLVPESEREAAAETPEAPAPSEAEAPKVREDFEATEAIEPTRTMTASEAPPLTPAEIDAIAEHVLMRLREHLPRWVEEAIRTINKP
ncbi:MAG: hypothetical protein D6771_05450 [Zetaproteobacteria bacterium]|nr:MAG: hypothetical protein D6771_05450 [Zetaproteobacteria bacterium]